MLHGSRLSKGDSLESLEVLDQPLSCHFWQLFFIWLAFMHVLKPSKK